MYDEKAEEGVLSVLLSTKDIYYLNSNTLFEQLFWKIQHRRIFQAIVLTASEGKTVDIVTVADTIIKHGLVKRDTLLGDSILGDIARISSKWNSAYSFDSHLAILKESYKRRKLYEISHKVQTQCNDLVDPDDIITQVNIDVATLSLDHEEEFNVNQIVGEVITEMKDPVPKRMIPSGIKNLDAFIYGFEYGDQIVIGGAASMGKTAFALRLFQNFIDADCYPVYFSREMTKAQLISRLIASEGEIPFNAIRRRQLVPYLLKRLDETGNKLAKQKFIIDDKTCFVENMVNKMRIYKMKYGSRVFIFDYLQLINAAVGKSGNREQEVAKISRSLKEAALELDVLTIPLSQINRDASKSGNHRPSLTMLRESGAIEQDADFVFFPFRDEYYQMQEGKISKPSYCEEAELIIAKGRSTGTGSVPLRFISTFTKYLNDENETSKDIQEADQKAEQQTEFKAESNDDVPF